MKRLLFSLVFMVLCLSSASAFADSTAIKPYNWTGLYLGLQGSYDVGSTDWDSPIFGTHTDHTLKGGAGGLFLGYNYQFPINVVVGVETDLNYGKITGSSSCPNGSYSCNSEINWFGSTRARVGYAFWRLLPYVAVGVAYTRADLYTEFIATGTEFSSTGDYRFGWTPSIGLEFVITKNLLARAEYAYYDFGSKSVTFSDGELLDNGLRFQGLKLGLAWKFGGAKEASQPIAEEVAPEPAPLPPPPPPPAEEMKKAP